MRLSGKQRVIGLILALALGVLALWLAVRWELFTGLKVMLEEQIHPAVFILLMALAPVVGVPISIFLVLAGVRFGTWQGILLMAATMPVNMIICYLLSRGLLERFIRRVAADRGYELPQFPPDRVVPYSLIFVAFPGPPYSLKCYILPLLGVPFWHYLWISWVVEAALGIPFVGFGGAAARTNFTLSALFVGVFVLIYLLLRWLKKRYPRVRSYSDG